jgi:CRISPR-associated protein Csh1
VIESIYQIGRSAQGGSEGRRMFLESLALEAPRPKKGRPTIAVLKLDLASLDFDVEVSELDAEGEKSSARYLWLGNAAGANSDQDRITTDNLGYLLTQTVPNLLQRLSPDTELHTKLNELVDKLYLDLGEPDEVGVRGGGAYRRYRRFWDLGRIAMDGVSVEAARGRVREADNAREVPKLVNDAFYARYGSRLGRDRMLFTLELDGTLVVDHETYQEYLEKILVDTVFEDAPYGKCHLTGNEGPVTSNMTRFGFKYYITDKQGFAAGARSEGFSATMGLSKEAYKALLVGERFVRRRLGFYLAGTNGYLLPDLYVMQTPEGLSGDLDRVLKAVKSRTDLDLGLQDTVDEEIERITERGNYSLNLLFYRQNKANFKVLRLVQDVPAYRLQDLRRRGRKFSREIGGALFGESKQWDLTMRNIYYLLPVRKSGTNVLSKLILEFYATLMGGGLVNRRDLVDGFVELVNVYRFGNYASYHVSEPPDADYALVRYVAHTNLLLGYLRSLGQLKEEYVGMDYLKDLHLSDGQRGYLERLHYTEEQTALYLLGTLVAEIANAQWRLGPGGRNGDKTILNKINYGGMTVARAQRLATDLFDKLTQYRDRNRRPLLQGRNEMIFAQAQALLTQHRDDWSLDAAQNVYYILSGYSHATLQAIRHRPADGSGGQTSDTTIPEGAQA